MISHLTTLDFSIVCRDKVQTTAVVTQAMKYLANSRRNFVACSHNISREESELISDSPDRKANNDFVIIRFFSAC